MRDRWRVAGVRALRYVGWLLRVNRRFGHDSALRSGREFAGAFRSDASRPLAPSQITRWENGELAVSRATIRRYEHLLGLRAESLVTLADAVTRNEDATPALAELEWIRPDERRDRMFDLLDCATASTTMTGESWAELTELIAAQPHLELYPPKLWQEIADRLLRELVVAEGSAWLQRQEAMSRLLEHPAARRHAVDACVALAGDPTSPAVVEPLSLLDVTQHPDANRYILAQLDRPDSDRALQGALQAAVRKVSKGHFRGSEWAQLVQSVRTVMTDPATNHALLPLILHLGRVAARQQPGNATLRRSLPSTPLAHRIWAVGRTAGRDVSLDVGRRVAALAQTQVSDDSPGSDEVLAVLVEECLFGANPDRRMIAAMLIAATPYRTAVAAAIHTQLLADIARRTHVYPATAALRTLTQLNVDIHRPLIHDILLRPGSGAAMRYAAAWATPHCPGRSPAPAWRRILAVQLDLWQRSASEFDETVLQGITYGIGTDRHYALLGQIRDDPIMPPSARTTASWMLNADLSRG